MSGRSVGVLMCLALLVLTGCGARTGSLRGYAEVLSAFDSAGLNANEVPDPGRLGNDLMATEYHVVEVEEALVHVCIYPEDVLVTTTDGYTFTPKKPGSEITTVMNLDWAEQPRVFQKDNVLVVFATSDTNLADRILSALKEMHRAKR